MIYNSLIELPRKVKIIIILTFDILIAWLTLFFSFVTRFETFFPKYIILKEAIPFFFLLPLIIILMSKVFSIHNLVLRTFNIKSIYALSLYSLGISLFFVLINFLGNLLVPRSIPIIFFLYFLLSIILVRVVSIQLIEVFRRKSQILRNIIIFGAGNAGRNLFSSTSMSSNNNIIGFIDDNPNLLNTKVFNLNVFSRNEFRKIFKNLSIDEIWVATPSAREKEKLDIIRFVNDFKVKVLSLPSFNEMIFNGDKQNKLTEIRPEHFLGRDDVSIESKFFDDLYNNKHILVTGAGGSIGSEICIQASKLKPKKIVLFDSSEFNLYQIQESIAQLNISNEIEFAYCLGSVCSKSSINRVINKYNIDVIFHAAAYKHVNILEKNIIEGFNNNVIGTYNVVTASVENQIERFVLVSTDKAVKPTNFMGITKRISELIVGSHSKISNTSMSIVRFGNVIGSSGSVIPLFKKQILNGGPETVTDPKMTRFFMSIPEAAQLILIAGSYGCKAEVFLLDMGEPIKIIDLAKNMIMLYGYDVKDSNNPNGDIEIKITSVKPGEKINEQLQIGKETIKTSHPKVFMIKDSIYELDKILNLVEKISKCIDENDISELKSLVTKDYILQND